MANPEKSFKETLANALAKAFWDNLIDHLKADSIRFGSNNGNHTLTEAEVTEKIGRTLGLDAYTVGRWFNGKTFVHPNKFFVVLLSLKIRVSDVRFDDRLDLIRKAMMAMVERIERVNLKGGKSGNLDDRKLECLKHVYAHPLAHIVFILSNRNRIGPQRSVIFRDVTFSLKQDGTWKDWNEKGVEQVSDTWYHAYYLYMLYRPIEWEFLREI